MPTPTSQGKQAQAEAASSGSKAKDKKLRLEMEFSSSLSLPPNTPRPAETCGAPEMPPPTPEFTAFCERLGMHPDAATDWCKLTHHPVALMLFMLVGHIALMFVTFVTWVGAPPVTPVANFVFKLPAFVIMGSTFWISVRQWRYGPHHTHTRIGHLSLEVLLVSAAVTVTATAISPERHLPFQSRLASIALVATWLFIRGAIVEPSKPTHESLRLQGRCYGLLRPLGAAVDLTLKGTNALTDVMLAADILRRVRPVAEHCVTTCGWQLDCRCCS